MAGDLIYAYRVMQLPLLDADGSIIGRLEDILLTSGARGEPPIVLGFVATAQRRRIFVNAARIAGLESDGARLRSWDVDLNPFKQRPGELLVSKDLLDKQVGEETVSDIALRPTPTKASTWEVAKVRLAGATTLRRRPDLSGRRLGRGGPALRHERGRGRGRPAARHAPDRRRPARPQPPARPARRSSPRRWRTSGSPTSSRS